jgi:sphinganine-1-phosphate aldolase
MSLPPSGESRESILGTLERYREHDVAWRSGRTFGFVYDPGTDALELGKEAYGLFLTENGLDPTSFPSLLRLENEVVGMARDQAGGDAEVVGAFTSGGTESIMLAVKAARDLNRKLRPSLRDPEIVVPLTAHAAFHKAAHYLGLKIVVTPVDPVTFKADVAAMREAITERTILIVGSAPSYAHGVIDPIREIAALAAERDLLCHVDACVGGWLLPYFRKLGAEIPAFDFRVPGVTSMSMDLHKYAFCPKGASIVLYRKAALRRHQIFACAAYPGYVVLNMTVQSSKPGGPVAGAWAVMRRLGDEGYLEIARRMQAATAEIVKGIAEIPGLAVLGKPEMSLLAFTSSDASVFTIADEMKTRGWYVQPQLRRGPSPENIHLTVGPTNGPWVPTFLADLRDSVQAAKGQPESPLAAQLGGAMAGLDAATVSDEMLAQMLAMAGAGGGVPGRMSEVNQILNQLPGPLVERLLVEALNGMFRTSQ